LELAFPQIHPEALLEVPPFYALYKLNLQWFEFGGAGHVVGKSRNKPVR